MASMSLNIDLAAQSIYAMAKLGTVTLRNIVGLFVKKKMSSLISSLVFADRPNFLKYTVIFIV